MNKTKIDFSINFTAFSIAFFAIAGSLLFAGLSGIGFWFVALGASMVVGLLTKSKV